MINFILEQKAIIGGALLGLASGMLMYTRGQIFGCSGILSGLFNGNKKYQYWRFLMIFSMIIGALVISISKAPSIVQYRSIPALIIGGFLIGIGPRVGNGCTSGHGICGLSRLSTRSLVAVITFITAGVITVTLMSKFGIN